MPQKLRVFLVIAVAGAFWLLTSSFGNSASECFYRSVPVIALTIFLTGPRNRLETWRAQLRPGVSIAAGLLLMAACLVTLAFGRYALLSWRIWAEVGTMLYLLIALGIVLLFVLRLLLRGVNALTSRWKCAPALRGIVAQGLPITLFAMFALPFGLAFANVHRFKLPNFVNPKSAVQRDYEDVIITSADGTRLRGWWIPARRPSTRTIVFCHGLAVNRSQALEFHEVGDWLDANILAFDLRGHGDSDGRTVTMGYLEKDDVLAAIAYVRRERPEQARQVIGMGVSLGAAAMAQAAAAVEEPLAAVILDSGFASTREMTHYVLDPFPSFLHGWLLTAGLPLIDLHAGCPLSTVCPAAAIHRLRAPVLILHSRRDPMIPSEHSVRFYQLAAEPKQLHIFEVDGHSEEISADHDRYRDAVIEFAKWLQK